MSDSLTILEEADGTAVLTLNRPEKRNALARALCKELVDVARTLARDVACLAAGMSESARRGFVAHRPRLFEA